MSNSRQEKYFVSHFEKTELYGGRHTYVYGASVTDSHNPHRTVGGIGIVFDGEFQFRSMLNDAIETEKDSFAVFTDRNGKIISATAAGLKPAGALDIPAHFFKTANGSSISEILKYNGAYYAVGCACSASYREYKNNDGYANDVLAFVFSRLADIEGENAAGKKHEGIQQSEIKLSDWEPHVKLAAFMINRQLFAMDQASVLEAMDAERIVSVPESLNFISGAAAVNNKYVAVINTRRLLNIPENEERPRQLLVVELPDTRRVALEVDELSHVLEVNARDIKSVSHTNSAASVIKGVFCIENDAERAALVIDQEALLQKINSPFVKKELDDTLTMIDFQNLIGNK